MCTSADHNDLITTDEIASTMLEDLIAAGGKFDMIPRIPHSTLKLTCDSSDMQALFGD